MEDTMAKEGKITERISRRTFLRAGGTVIVGSAFAMGCDAPCINACPYQVNIQHNLLTAHNLLNWSYKAYKLV